MFERDQAAKLITQSSCHSIVELGYWVVSGDFRQCFLLYVVLIRMNYSGMPQRKPLHLSRCSSGEVRSVKTSSGDEPSPLDYADAAASNAPSWHGFELPTAHSPRRMQIVMFRPKN